MKSIWKIAAQKKRIAEARARKRTDLKPPSKLFA